MREALERMERRAKIALKHTKEDMDHEKTERWKRAVEHYTCAAEAIKEVQKYRAIGSIAKCQEAVEKQRAKKPVLNENSEVMFCPVCERKVRRNYDLHCNGCGQAIDWSDE